MARRYYLKSKTTNSYLFIEHGGTVFKPAADVKNDEDMEVLNRAEGVTLNEIKAAEICALSGKWDNYSEIVNESCKM